MHDLRLLREGVEQLRNGASFAAYARQFSEASTAAVGGDLGWVQAEQLPQPLAVAAQNLPVPPMDGMTGKAYDDRGIIGLGEPPVISPGAAIANAVARASGVRLRRLPLAARFGQSG